MEVIQQPQFIKNEAGQNIFAIISIDRYNSFVEKEQNTQDRLAEYLAIPKEYRINPYDYSPSGDLFFADRRNVEKLESALVESKKSKIINPDNLWEDIK